MKLRLSLKLLFLLSLIVSVLFRPESALAHQITVKRAALQSDISVENLRVDIWPEYDQPAVLVFYHFTLSSQVALPATMEVRIPASAGKPHAVAMQDVAGLYNLNYEMAAAGEWIIVKFTTPVPDIRIEYYDPSLEKNGNTREYVFRWPGNYSVNNLSVSVQKPANATAMTFRPALGSGSTGSDGLTYYNLVVGKVNEGTPFDLAISYDKPDDSLTNAQQFQQAQPNQPIDSATTGRVTLDQALPWALGGLGLLLIAAGSLWYWKTGRAPATAARPRHVRRPAAVAAAEGAGNGEAGGTFCHQCGKKAGASDVFCRACGTKLR